MDNIYPIGSIFISTNTTNPSTYFGGKWERIKGRFLLAANDSTYKIGSTGGEATHKLTIDEMPLHGHSSYLNYNGNVQVPAWSIKLNYTQPATASTGLKGKSVLDNGGDKAHNNMPPYLVVYIWKRIS